MNVNEFNGEIRGIKNDFLDFKLNNPDMFRRKRCKPRESDGRRKYDFTADMIFFNRYKALGCNQSALARELGISQVAVRKRLIRVKKELAEDSQGALTLLMMAMGEIPTLF
jgi:hypothetical protein